MVAKKVSEKYKRIKCSTLAKLLNGGVGTQMGESVYNWKEEESKGENIGNLIGGGGEGDTESIYSMRTDNT